MPTTAHPPSDPDHGLNATTFPTLWSGDSDAFVADGSASRSAIEELANGTDIPLDSPPEAVKRWNSGELRDFPRSGDDESIHPPNARLSNGRFIEDAHVSIFAVNPSTRIRLSPTDQPLYVAPSGSILGTIDYRVETPADDDTGDFREYWRVRSHRIDEVRLEIDGRIETVSSGTNTPSLDYSSLDAYSGEDHTLAVAADISVEVERHVRIRKQRCRTVNNSTTCWSWWDDDYSYPSESVTIRDAVEVTEYDLTIAGFRARYPNGDLGLLIYKNRPWLGYSLPNGAVQGVWRFYSARDSDWDALVSSTASGDTERHSPLHPLQVNAYPIEPGPTAAPRDTVTILETYGEKTQPPTLPSNVHLDVLAEPYTASYGVVTRTRTTDHDLTEVVAYGLVRGEAVNVTPGHFGEIPISRSELELAVLDADDETVTVRVRLRDADTGRQINTVGREGYVLLDGDRVNTSGNGTVTKTLPRPAGGISARYVPGRWWFAQTGYVGDSDVVYVHGTVLDGLSVLYRIAVPVSLFLFGVFIIDRFTGWQVWPPWRGM